MAKELREMPIFIGAFGLVAGAGTEGAFVGKMHRRSGGSSASETVGAL